MKKEFLNKVVDLLEVIKLELQLEEAKNNDMKTGIKIGHKISAVHKVKQYIKQRIKTNY
tara:strand:- start:223 stop:399 length:177 start_codon:yes stop_codon:yes gene_type:complete